MKMFALVCFYVSFSHYWLNIFVCQCFAHFLLNCMGLFETLLSHHQGWPWTHALTDLTSEILGLHMCKTTARCFFSYLIAGLYTLSACIRDWLAINLAYFSFLLSTQLGYFLYLGEAVFITDEIWETRHTNLQACDLLSITPFRMPVNDE